MKKNIFLILLGVSIIHQDSFCFVKKMKKAGQSGVNTVAQGAAGAGTAIASNDIVQGQVGVMTNTGKAVGNVATGNFSGADKNMKNVGDSYKQIGGGFRDLGVEVGTGVQKGFEQIGKGIEDAWDDGAMALVRESFGSYPHKHDSASVRLPGASLPSGLQQFEISRKAKVKQKLSDNFGIDCTDSSMPKIGFCLSGGGFRAMIAGVGFLSGADKIGLFDCAMYNAGLSGGTWALGPASWMQLKKGMNIQDYKNKLVKNVHYGVPTPVAGMTGPPFVEYPASDVVAENYVKRMAWKQKITSIDLWGALVGNVILQGADGWSLKKKGKRLSIKFSELAPNLVDGSMPLPMLSAVRPTRSVVQNDVTGYRWFGMNPFESGMEEVGGYVPTWSLGRKFSKGKTVKGFEGHAPEYPFSYWLGVAGSAFAINLHFMYGNEIPSFKMGSVKIKIPKSVYNARFMPCEVNNYLKGISSGKLGSRQNFTLVDAGLDFNLPMPLLLKPEPQSSDIIFMFDSSAGMIFEDGHKDEALGEMGNKSAQLELLNQYNTKMNKGVLPYFDPLTTYNMYQNGHVMTVFNDPRKDDYNPDVPVCLYFPLIKNPAYTKTITGTNDPEIIQNYKDQSKNFMSTFNFNYSAKQADWLAGLTESNVIAVKDEIKAVMAAWVAKRSEASPSVTS